jgi:hypothetical protein
VLVLLSTYDSRGGVEPLDAVSRDTKLLADAVSRERLMR